MAQAESIEIGDRWAGPRSVVSPMVQESLYWAGVTVERFAEFKLSLQVSDMSSVTVSETPSTVRERALRAPGQLPPFSPILNRLIASLAQEDVSFAKVADLIEKDTVLAGNVLDRKSTRLNSSH